MRAETIGLVGHRGDEIEAYLARPLERDAVGGVVVLHHMPGLDEHTREVTRRLAAAGYLSICPNLYSREAPGASPEDAFAVIWEQGGVDDEQVIGDVAGCTKHLGSLRQSNGRVAAIGFCAGGRQALLAGCSIPLAATVDCYGSFVVNPPQAELNLRVTTIVHLVEQLSCPLLGLFGGDDQSPAPDEVAALAEALTEHGKDFEFHTHEDAGHAFFATNRPSYRVNAANDGWLQIVDFFERHIS